MVDEHDGVGSTKLEEELAAGPTRRSAGDIENIDRLFRRQPTSEQSGEYCHLLGVLRQREICVLDVRSAKHLLSGEYRRQDHHPGIGRVIRGTRALSSSPKLRDIAFSNAKGAWIGNSSKDIDVTRVD